MLHYFYAVSMECLVSIYWPQVVQVWDLLHAQPAELAAADSAGHVVAAAVVHFDDVSGTAGARFDVISWEVKGGGKKKEYSFTYNSHNPPLIISLVGIYRGCNLGSCLRTCEWSDVHGRSAAYRRIKWAAERLCTHPVYVCIGICVCVCVCVSCQ